MPNSVIVGQTIWAFAGVPKNFGVVGPSLPWDGRVADQQKHASAPHVLSYQIWSV